MPTINDLVNNNSKEALAAGLVRAGEKARKLKDAGKEVARQAMDLGYAGLGGGIAGAWIGKIQRDIQEGNATEEDFKIVGVPKDLALSLLMVGFSRTKWAGKADRALKYLGLGAFGFFTGRTANNYVLDMEDEEEDEG